MSDTSAATDATVRDQIRVAVQREGILAASTLYQMFPGKTEGMIRQAASSLAVKHKQFKRSRANGEWYLRTKNTPLPDGHVDHGFKNLRVMHAARKSASPSKTEMKLNGSDSAHASVQVAVVVNGTALPIDIDQAKTLYEQLHRVFG